MRLIPLIRGMKLYCRRLINVGGRNYLEGEELPYRRLSLSWRLVLKLYEQRRVVSENDSYFQELMEIWGVKNNPDFAKLWLKENGVKNSKKDPQPKKEKSRRKTKVQKATDTKKKVKVEKETETKSIKNNKK